MQKIRTFFTFFTCISLLSGIFFPLGASFAWRDKYDYSDFYDKINISSHTGEFEKTLIFDTPRTSFSLVFPESMSLGYDDLQVDWIIDDALFTRHLDLDDRNDDTSQVISTFPFVTSARSSIKVRISHRSRDLPESIGIISSNQESIGRSLTFSPGSQALWASDSPHIISRAEWGADESIRYLSQADRQKRIDDWIARGKTPRIVEVTESDREKETQSNSEYNTIVNNDIDANTIQSIERYDGNNKLRWPIARSKTVNRIVIHHTSEEFKQDSDDDAKLIRAIYLYHARTRGWGDIGYNFIIGQRGLIYEGRAGGDYTAGAHVYANNMGTVGISMIGNYSSLHLNKDQKSGLIEAITYVADKYGIDVTENAIGVKVCGKNEGCTWKKVTTQRLLGHRDIGATDCPGENLYNTLPELRSLIVGKVGNNKPIYNTLPEKKDPIDPEDRIEYKIVASYEQSSKVYTEISHPEDGPILIPKILRPDISSLLRAEKISAPDRSVLPSGPEVKVKISYPKERDSIELESATAQNTILLIGKRRIIIKPSEFVYITQGTSGLLVAMVGKKKYIASSFALQGDLIRIASWSRPPSWDTTGKYNDNIFRGRIVVRNMDEKILVVNELPLENYLKGMGEVSESVDVKNYPEKVKALIVSGRSYAYFYQNPKLPLGERKFQTILYDISDDPDTSQVYKGYGYELRSPNYRRLVDDTQGEIVTYKGLPIKVWYFSSSDGRTLSYQEYCESRGNKNCIDIPYLQSVSDPAGLGKNRSGHGVGISGIGATYFAREGWDYKQIIQYYMNGVEISKK